MDNNTRDPALCVAIERGAGGWVALVMTDGDRIGWTTMVVIHALILRERLTVVGRAELRSLASRLPGPENRAAPADDSTAPADVTRWQAVAGLQEQFRAPGDGWEWWRRFCACNNAGDCLELLTMLAAVVGECGWVGPMSYQRVDRLEQLHSAIRQSPARDAASLREALRRIVRDRG